MLAVESENARRRMKTLHTVERATGATTPLVEARFIEDSLFVGTTRATRCASTQSTARARGSCTW
jgi:hypothetical protein